jgi:hypothetical protein
VKLEDTAALRPLTRARQLVRWARQHWRLVVGVSVAIYIVGPVVDVGAAKVFARCDPFAPGANYAYVEHYRGLPPGVFTGDRPCPVDPPPTGTRAGFYLSHPAVRIAGWTSDGGLAGFGLCESVQYHPIGCR